MDAKVISAARWKTLLYLAGSLAFVGGSLLALQHPDREAWKLWGAVAFFGLCSAVFAWLLVRPQNLRLDAEGFTVTGGFVRSPKTIPWSDVENFFVHRLPKGGKMIGFNYRPGARRNPPMLRGVRFGADGALPKGWPQAPERMVEELNAYRTTVLAAKASAARADERTAASPLKVLVCALDPKFRNMVGQDGETYRRYFPATRMAVFADGAAFLATLAEGFDIVHLFCDAGAHGVIGELGVNGTALIEKCCAGSVKLLWIASDNAPPAYIDGFATSRRPINVVMTLAREGAKFDRFLRELLAGMSAGEGMGSAWVRLAPQGPPGPAHDESPATIVAMGRPAWPGSRERVAAS